MCFEVHANGPLDGEWEARDRKLVEVAGRKYDFSVTGKEGRDCWWLVPTFYQARKFLKVLRSVKGAKVTIREFTSQEK